MAVLAALNLANELIDARHALERLQALVERIELRIAPRIEELLGERPAGR